MHRVQYKSSETEDFYHAEFEGGVSATLKHLIGNRIVWNNENERVSKFFTFNKANYKVLQSYNSNKAKQLEALNLGDIDCSYTDGARLQFYLEGSDSVSKPAFKYSMNETEDQSREITGQHHYIVWNSVILNTNKRSWGQQFHIDWYIKEGKEKEKGGGKKGERKKKTINIFLWLLIAIKR